MMTRTARPAETGDTLVTYRTVFAFTRTVERLPEELRRAFALLFTASLQDSAVSVFEAFCAADRMDDLHHLLEEAEDLRMERADEVTRLLMAWEHDDRTVVLDGAEVLATEVGLLAASETGAPVRIKGFGPTGTATGRIVATRQVPGTLAHEFVVRVPDCGPDGEDDDVACRAHELEVL